MHESAILAYEKRFVRVMNFINSRLCESLNLDELCRAANFSKYHFQRQFSEYFGISVYRYIQLLRLKRASYQLAFRQQLKVTEIALSSGFKNAESFSRAFKQFIGQTPTQFRKSPHWFVWGEKFKPLTLGKFLTHPKPESDRSIKIMDFPQTKIAVLEHRGSPALLGDSIRQFIQWRQFYQQLPPESATYNLLYCDEDHGEPERFHVDLGASTRLDIGANQFGVTAKNIPASRCAVLRHVGDERSLKDSFRYIYGDWLPKSGEEVRDFPPFLHRVTLYPDVPAHKNIVDIHLPLK